MMLKPGSPRVVSIELMTPFLDKSCFHASIRSIKFIHIGSMTSMISTPCLRAAERDREVGDGAVLRFAGAVG